MNPLGTRARSEQLARRLDDDPASVAVAARLHSLGADLSQSVTPRADYREALRTRLLAVAAVKGANAEAPKARALDAAAPWSQSRRAQRGIALAAGAMASVVAVAGVAVAGSRSLPGDPFYSVKRGAEAFELTTTSGQVAKGSKHLAFAAERLKEVRELSLGRDAAFTGPVGTPLAADAFGGAASRRIRATLAGMDSETRTGSALLTAAYRSNNDTAPLQILARFADRQSHELQQLLPSVPAAARPSAARSLALVRSVAVHANQLLAVDPAPAPAPTTAPQPTTAPSPSPSPSPSPQSPEPRPSSSPLLAPIPTVPVPVPVLPSPPPLPLPTITSPALPGAVATLLPSLPARPLG